MSDNQAKFVIGVGTVQTYVYRETPYFRQYFGCPVYEREKPVLSASRKIRAQPIVDLMNDGSISPEEGMRRLEQEAFW